MGLLLFRSRSGLLARFRVFSEILLILKRVYPDGAGRVGFRIDVEPVAAAAVDLRYPARWERPVHDDCKNARECRLCWLGRSLIADLARDQV